MHKLAELCVRRPVFATMLIVSITVVGIYSFLGLGVDFFPNIDVPTVSVSVSNPGASAEQVETEITKLIEGSVNTISGIDELHSTSSEGASQVVLQFLLEKDGDVAAQEVRDKVNLVIGQLPLTARPPVIQKADPGASPVLQIAVAGSRPIREITEFADKEIKQQIESINGVGQVRIVGGATREIHVRLEPDRLRSYGITVAEVASALRQQNLTLPGGRVEQGARELTVRTMGKVSNPSEFEALAVANRGDYVVRIGDLGEVVDTQAELRTASFLNGTPAVTLVVSKQSGQNLVQVARTVKERFSEIVSTLPAGITAQIVDDQSLFIEASISAIEEHLILGSFLASFVIFIFLANIRTTLIAAVAIPTSIISTFGLMSAMGYTLNQVTMLALTLMVGVVIDDAIIVLENIYRYIEEKGMPPFEAAIKGTKEIGLAVMATTLSLLAVFIPVGFMSGVVGRVLSSFAFTAAFAVAVSLLVSFTLTPMLSSRFIKVPGNAGKGHGSKDSPIFRPIDRGYMAMLRWSMAHRLTIVVACILVTASIVPLFSAIGKDFAPQEDRSEFQVSVKTPEGTSLSATTTIVERIATDLRAMPNVRQTLVTIGGGAVSTGFGPAGSASSVSSGSIRVALVPPEDRVESQPEVMVQARALLQAYPDTLRTSIQAIGGPGGGAGAEFSIRGPDLARLGGYASELLDRVQQSPLAVDADSSLVYGKPELRVRINRQRAADLGVRVQDIAQALNLLVGGGQITTFDVGEDQYDVTLRAAERSRSTVAGIEQMTVASSKRGIVSIGDVVDIVPTTGPSSIQRLNRQRQVTISANVAPGASQATLVAAIQQAAADMNLPSDYVAEPAGQSVQLAETGTAFLTAIALSFIFMYIVLAAQFESFVHPITILLTLPLAVPFGILSLLVFGQTVNLFAGLGLLLLFGIVKKNAILQIDHTNGLRATGMPRYEAILQANRDRLRPILMTTIALVAGMLPLVISSGAGSAGNRSIGVLVVGGQTLCLLLTLLAVPVFYSLFDDLESWTFWSRLGARRRRLTTALVHPAGESVDTRVAEDHAE